MTLQVRRATSVDREQVERLLCAEQLPLQGIAEHLGSFMVAEIDGVVSAVAGLERHEEYGLLRSVVVAATQRGQRVADKLVRAQIEDAARQGLRALYLLTLTAEAYFTRFGFELTDRSDIPLAVQRSHEFAGACPASARAMHLALVPRN